MILQNDDVMAFAATTQPDKARAFYCDVLGLGFEEDTPFALVLRAANATVRIQKVQSFTPLPFTVMGWKVADIHAVAAQLKDRGVSLERFAGMSQDELGIWSSPGGAKVGWFKDPDGNLLSLTQFA
jgi:catechol 2,3-dioxygenase-like lactoylglutathione lyase family enzyme